MSGVAEAFERHCAMAAIFISYRVDDSKAWAISLRDDLAAYFDDDEIFLDKEGLQAGKWAEQLTRELVICQVFILLIGKQWLTVVDDLGRVRLHQPDDVHRLEVATALTRAELTVIPLLVDDARLPSAEALPPDLRPLTANMARRLHDTLAHRQFDLQVLVADIAAATGLKAHTPVAPAHLPPWTNFLLSNLLRTGTLTLGIGISFYIGGSPLPDAAYPFLAMLSLGAILIVRRLWSRRRMRDKPRS